MNEEEFVKEWNEKMKKISDKHKNVFPYYIKVVNKEGGYVLAHEYMFKRDDYVLFGIWVSFKLLYVGGEKLKNIKELSIMYGWE
jgi:hypothetical protein